MKAKCILLMTLLYLSLTYASAQELKPLNEVIIQEKSGWNTLYIIQRCLAVNISISRRMKGSGRSDLEKALANYSKNIQAFTMQLLVQAEILGVSEKLNDLTNQIEKLRNIYDIMLDENYTLTGNSLSQTVMNDVVQCNDFYRTELQ